jgi:hypothetical protein
MIPRPESAKRLGASEVATTSFIPFTQRHAACPPAVCAHQTLTPSSWKLFAIPGHVPNGTYALYAAGSRRVQNSAA